jgi:hypothetical protein
VTQEAAGIDNFMWPDELDEREAAAQGRGKPRAPVGVVLSARSSTRSPHGLPLGAQVAERPGLVRLRDLVEVELPEAQLESMSRVQRVETMQELGEQHARLLGMAQNLHKLQARIGRRL